MFIYLQATITLKEQIQKLIFQKSLSLKIDVLIGSLSLESIAIEDSRL